MSIEMLAVVEQRYSITVTSELLSRTKLGIT